MTGHASLASLRPLRYRGQEYRVERRAVDSARAHCRQSGLDRLRKFLPGNAVRLIVKPGALAVFRDAVRKPQQFNADVGIHAGDLAEKITGQVPRERMPAWKCGMARRPKRQEESRA